MIETIEGDILFPVEEDYHILSMQCYCRIDRDNKHIITTIVDYAKGIFVKQMLLPKEELALQTMELMADKMELENIRKEAIKLIEEDILGKKIENVNWDYDECYYSDMPVERVKPLLEILNKGE